MADGLGPLGARAMEEAQRNIEFMDHRWLADSMDRISGCMCRGRLEWLASEEHRFAMGVGPLFPRYEPSDSELEALYRSCAPRLFDREWTRDVLRILPTALERAEFDAEERVGLATAMLLLVAAVEGREYAFNPVTEVVFFTQLESLSAPGNDARDELTSEGATLAVIEAIEARTSSAELPALWTRDEQLWLRLATAITATLISTPNDATLGITIMTNVAALISKRVRARAEAGIDDPLTDPADADLLERVIAVLEASAPSTLTMLFASIAPCQRGEAEVALVEGARDEAFAPSSLGAYRDWLVSIDADLVPIDAMIAMMAPPDDDDRLE